MLRGNVDFVDFIQEIKDALALLCRETFSSSRKSIFDIVCEVSEDFVVKAATSYKTSRSYSCHQEATAATQRINSSTNRLDNIQRILPTYQTTLLPVDIDRTGF